MVEEAASLELAGTFAVGALIALVMFRTSAPVTVSVARMDNGSSAQRAAAVPPPPRHR